MKIELKNVHYSPHSSQETACFTAAVWLDGKNAGTVRNAGQGGCHHYTPATLEASLAAHAATLQKVTINRTPIQPSADFIIDEAFTTWLIERDLKRMMATRFVFIRDGLVYESSRVQSRIQPASLQPDKLEELKRQFNTAEILNALPFDEAVRKYKAIVLTQPEAEVAEAQIPEGAPMASEPGF